jgi:hypothetical protein
VGNEEKPAKKKPRSVTDEWLDAYVNRPLAGVVVRAVEHTQVTPNHLTLLSVLIGVPSGICFAYPTPTTLFWGMLAIFAFLVLDCSDGQLARARGHSTSIGRIVDGVGDYTVTISMHLGMWAYLDLYDYNFWGWTPSSAQKFGLVLGAGISMILHSGIFDFYKHRYLSQTGQDGRGVVETEEYYRAERARATTLLDRALLSLFVFYMRAQAVVVSRKEAASTAVLLTDPQEQARFARENAWRVRLWGLIGPTGHYALFAATMFASIYSPTAPFFYIATILGAMNLFMIAMLIWVRLPNARKS